MCIVHFDEQKNYVYKECSPLLTGRMHLCFNQVNFVQPSLLNKKDMGKMGHQSATITYFTAKIIPKIHQHNYISTTFHTSNSFNAVVTLWRLDETTWIHEQLVYSYYPPVLSSGVIIGHWNSRSSRVPMLSTISFTYKSN